MKKKTWEDHLIDIIKMHGDKYEYPKEVSLTNNSITKVTLHCPVHGDFVKIINNLKQGQGCPKCGLGVDNWEDLKKRFNIIHKDKFKYINIPESTKHTNIIEIVCPIHGTFKQTIASHLSGRGCFDCGMKKKSWEYYLSKFKDKYGDKYKYPVKVEDLYVNKQIEIICPIHGPFKQRICDHLYCGCMGCGGKKKKDWKSTLLEFKEVHGDRYTYVEPPSNFNLTIDSKIDIVCSIHGTFKQRVRDHKTGSGCPVCKTSKMELKVIKYLKDHNIEYEYQYKCGCINEHSGRELVYDFYLKDWNLIIECDGEQHFKYKSFGGKKSNSEQNNVFIDQLIRDLIKNEFCEKKGYNILRIPYWDIGDIHNILKNSLKT